jgi:prefoldin subunit 5
MRRNKMEVQENIPELNTLKGLIQSLKYQLSEFNETNQKIVNLKSHLK